MELQTETPTVFKPIPNVGFKSQIMRYGMIMLLSLLESREGSESCTTQADTQNVLSHVPTIAYLESVLTNHIHKNDLYGDKVRSAIKCT